MYLLIKIRQKETAEILETAEIPGTAEILETAGIPGTAEMLVAVGTPEIVEIREMAGAALLAAAQAVRLTAVREIMPAVTLETVL